MYGYGVYCFEVLRYWIRCGGGVVVIYVDYFLLRLSKMVSFIFLWLFFCLVRLCNVCVGSWAFCLSWDAWSLRWFDSGSVFVSWCRCCVLVSAVQPVTILRAVFWVVCNFWRLVSDVLGDQMVHEYSMTGSIIVLYVASRVSFCLLQEAEVRLCGF